MMQPVKSEDATEELVDPPDDCPVSQISGLAEAEIKEDPQCKRTAEGPQKRPRIAGSQSQK